MVWTVCVFLTLFRVSQISGSLSDSPKRPPSVPASFSGCGSLSFASAPLPLGAGPVLSCPSAFFPSSLPNHAWTYTILSGRTPAGIQSVFCDSCSICGCIPDAPVERDAFHGHLLLHHLGSCTVALLNRETHIQV